MVLGRRETGSDQQRAEFVAIKTGGVRLVIQSGLEPAESALAAPQVRFGGVAFCCDFVSRGGRIYRPCDADGSDSDRKPDKIPAIVGAHGAGMVVVSTPDGVVAYRA